VRIKTIESTPITYIETDISKLRVKRVLILFCCFFFF